MSEKRLLHLQCQIHLLLNDLGEAARRRLLLRITRDGRARQLLQEMLICQESARVAFGYDRVDGLIGASLRHLKESLH